MADEIRLHQPFGDHRMYVKLAIPSGIAGDIWFVTIDGYHRGQMMKQNGAWVCHDSPLTPCEIEMLGNEIEKRRAPLV